MIFIETKRLILRNYQTGDFADIRAYFSNEEVSRYEDFYPMTDAQIADLLSEWIPLDNRLVAERKSDKTVIGSIGYWVDNEGPTVLIMTFIRITVETVTPRKLHRHLSSIYLKPPIFVLFMQIVTYKIQHRGNFWNALDFNACECWKTNVTNTIPPEIRF